MFSKILIANRGEIACRIIRTCRRLGVQTVAVYSSVDAGTQHTRQADEAYWIGEAPPRDSYLNIPKLLEVARQTGAEAVHPGYGFLSENPAFARAAAEAGLAFIGPRPEVMEQMGDKLLSRRLAKRAGVPVLPGTDDAVENDQAAARAWRLGFPLMVKAAEGGGGIGIHIINSQEELAPLIARARQTAAGAFGSARLYFERYLKDASHIEVQLVGDHHGNIIHLFERDCSVQRRNQKLIEETTASAKLTPRLRRRVASLALKLGQNIGYTNTGTAEFLVAADGSVYFLEMNTRLQVEHGVSEMITGLDLVELQLRVAAGEPLPLRQEDIDPQGHAIEARIYPEDPKTFMPDAGDITGLHLPEGDGLRIDTALCDGYTVGLDYEPLMAKVMAWGEDRQQAVQRLQRALLELRVEGVKHNVPLLRHILASPEFGGSTHHTGTMPHWINELDRKEQQHQGAPHHYGNGRHHANGNGESGPSEKELAALIGAAMAVGLQASRPPEPASAWRIQGRREQLLSRTLGSRGWL